MACIWELGGVEAGLELGEFGCTLGVEEGAESCGSVGGRVAAPELPSELSLLKKRVIGGAQPELLVWLVGLLGVFPVHCLAWRIADL